MNYNILTYTIFLSLASYVIFVVGHSLYKNGYYYILDLFKGDINLTTNINRILLVCYYLVNLGWVSISIITWGEITSIREVIENLTQHMSILLIVLGILHINNLISLALLARRMRSRSTQNKVL